MTSSHPRACVIGWPVGHSRSPLIHKYWLKQHNIEGDYVQQNIAPANLADFMRDFTQNGFIGANITVPHKQAVLNLLDETDDLARRLGAVNTVYVRSSRLFGTNTDGEGFLNHLKQTIAGWRSQGAVVVLGAGGAARAIIGALLDDGVEQIHVVNRTLAHAEEIAALFGQRCHPMPWRHMADAFPNAGLLVNATSLGMHNQPPLQIDLDRLGTDAVVADIVYVPLATDLLKTASTNGLAIVDGLGMLLHQAVPGFQSWFGVRPEITPELHELIVRDLDEN